MTIHAKENAITRSVQSMARNRAKDERPRTAIIADDEPLISVALKAELEALGLEVLGVAENGEDALRLAEERSPDIAMLDIRMPALDGVTAATRIWSETGVPTIIISAFSEPEGAQDWAAAGVFGYLLKPVDRESLRVTLAVAWSRFRETAESHRRIEQLETTIAGRRMVEQAKWHLVEQLGLTEPEAHSGLQKLARSRRSPLADVARDVLEGRLEFPLDGHRE